MGPFRLAVAALIVVVLVGGYLVYRFQGHHHPGATGHSGRVTDRPDAQERPARPRQRPRPQPRPRPRIPAEPGLARRRQGRDPGLRRNVHFEGAIGERLAANPDTALSSVASLLSGADLSMTNFESALTSGGCPDPQPKQFVFSAPKTALTAFKAAHVTVVTEANNHGEDCGRAGLGSHWRSPAGRLPGSRYREERRPGLRPYQTRVDGQRIAIIAATEVSTRPATAWTATATSPGWHRLPGSELVAAVQARTDNDTVVVYLHWGTETESCPTRFRSRWPRRWSRPARTSLSALTRTSSSGPAISASRSSTMAWATWPSTTRRRRRPTAARCTSRSPAGISTGSPGARPRSPMPSRSVSQDAAATEAVERWKGLRGCTDLTAAAGTAPTASSQSETSRSPARIPPLGG